MIKKDIVLLNFLFSNVVQQYTNFVGVLTSHVN